MQRPTRILVFGIFCLVMGFFSGLDNLNGSAVALLGPSMVPAPASGSGGGQFGEMMQDMTRATREALEKPAYRITLGLEALCGSVMAGVLIVGGIGLLRDRAWALRLVRIWAGYALLAAAVTVVLQVRYVMPAISGPGMAGAGVLSAMCMLPILWAFPVLILTLLSRPAVVDYLRWRAGQAPARAFTPTPPGQAQQGPQPQQTPSQTPGPRNPEPTPTTPGPQDAWRDDPWNDPNSK